MAAPIAHISEFNVDSDDFVEYSERFDNFLAANKITDAGLKKSTFIACIGGPAYKLLRSLCQNDTKAKTYEELIKLLTDHLSPKPNDIATRFTFYKRDRNNGESVNEYVAELRRLSENCNFGDTLNTYLRDRFVCGLNSESVQQKLLTMKDLTLDTALETARTFEKAYKDARAIRGAEVGGMNRLQAKQSGEGGSKKECFRCGSSYHLANKCGFKNSNCFNCGMKGHTKQKCRNEKKEGKDKKAGMHSVEVEEAEIPCQKGTKFREPDEVEEVLDFLSIYRLAREKDDCLDDPIMVDMEVNGHSAKMELDTGAVVTVMKEHEFKSYGGKVDELEKSRYVLRSFSGDLVKPKGRGLVEVNYEGQRCELPVTVVDNDQPTLLGRDWLKKIRLNWNEVMGEKYPVECNVNSLADGRIDEVVKEFPTVFTDKLGCLKDFKISKTRKPDASPKFCKARPVPYAMRSRVEEELDRLERQGVWQKVTFSKWASPIVTVLKDGKDPSGPIRICGDYKVAVNKAAMWDAYPIPNTADQLATLVGGQKFTKLDLSQAYQQLELDDQAKELLTINTHRGLYQPSRLQFGIHSATGIFQREMDRRLSRIPFVKVRVDDILVSGRNDEEHMANLRAVLEALRDAGLTVKMSKCFFMRDEVEFCGFEVSKEGVKPMNKNVEAVMRAPFPSNTTELRSFLGMVNYYNSYLKDLATVCEPLHRLLRKGVVWKWCNECKKAFDKVKQALCEAPILVHFDPSKPIVVQCDASPYGLGTVLSHIMENGEERPVCYGSRTLSVAERNHGQVEKEGLSVCSITPQVSA